MKYCPYLSPELEDFWKLYQRQLKSEKTRSTYWSDIVSFINFAGKDFLDITQSDVDRFYFYHAKEKPIKLATLQKKFRELSAFSDFIADNIASQLGNEAYYENYFYGKLADLNAMVKMAKGHIPTVKEMDKLLNVAKENMMHYAMFTLAFRCAVKPSELLKIRPGDFMERQGSLYLEIGEKNSRRVIPLPEDMTAILGQYNEKRSKDASYYFYKKSMEKLNERALERLVQDYALKAGIPPITMYGIRDAAVALMCASGAKDSYIARDCGLTERAVERYKEIIPAYTLKESAIGLVRIRVLPADSAN